MTDRKLQKLNKSELLEIMLEQSQRIDELEAQVEELQKQLMRRELTIEQSGSIADAAVRLSRVFEAAQEAADLYLENVRNKAVSEGYRDAD